MHIPSRRVFQISLGSTVYTKPCSDEVFELPRERSFKLKYCSDDSYTFRDMLKSREEAATKGSSIDNAKETGDCVSGELKRSLDPSEVCLLTGYLTSLLSPRIGSAKFVSRLASNIYLLRQNFWLPLFVRHQSDGVSASTSPSNLLTPALLSVDPEMDSAASTKSSRGPIEAGGKGRREKRGGEKRGNYRNPRLARISRVYNVEPSEGSLIALYKNRGKD
ncbi:hypothetical protein Anapl_16857 [Anas platyrhynchos]|uniref:Uncharacterized protein n=1 Tax=Anas platyrhynchos TaxID=8839 RepID=R0JAI3_ANAPL|nr:hypothetical protein Anapl_16857 [Anas platyrhynchos]